jgi:hypothetical protein
MNTRSLLAGCSALFIVFAPPIPAASIAALPDRCVLPNEAKPRIPKWEPGVNYVVMVPPRRTHVPSNKIEVLFRVVYSGPITRVLQPCMREWLSRKPPYVEYVERPSIWRPHARLLARMYFTMEELGRRDLLDSFTDWVQQSDHFKIYHQIHNTDERAVEYLNFRFAENRGLDLKMFVDVYRSQVISGRVIDEEIEIHEAGDSTIIVNGKYGFNEHRIPLKDGDSIAATVERSIRIFALIDYLVAKEAKELELRGTIR